MKDILIDVESELYNIPLFGKKVGLKNIEQMIIELDKVLPIIDYLNNTRIIHTTGTNGKGSVCNMLSEIYVKEGYSVGLFTSPHIDHITERVQLNNNNVSEDLFIEGYKCIYYIVEKLGKKGIEPTFFEWVFAISLYCFVTLKPDILIIEVGIGGKLDTTNVLPQKDLCIITPIGLDHQGILGDTIIEIAKEKAGIIKANNKVVFYNELKEVEKVVDAVARENEAIIYKVLPNSKKILNFSQLGIDFSIHNKYYCYEKLRLTVCAKYQIENVSIALTAVNALLDILPVTKSSISYGIKAFYWPGRFELLTKNLVVDGAHNELGAKILIDSIKFMYGNRKVDILISMKEGKNVDEVLKVFRESGCFNHFYIVDLTIQKPVPKEILMKKLKMNSDKVTLISELKLFLMHYLNQSLDQVLIGVGSLYLVSEIRKIILEEEL